MKPNNLILAVVVILLFICFSLAIAQDPNGPDSVFAVCNGSVKSTKVNLGIYLKTDNTGAGNGIVGLAGAFRITNSNAAAMPVLDTTKATTYAGNLPTFDFLSKFVASGGGSPSIFPLVYVVGAVDFGDSTSGLFAGTHGWAHFVFTVKDTTTICIDTTSTETVQGIDFVTSSAIGYDPVWQGGCFTDTCTGAFGSISGRKFNDENGNCLQDSGEAGLSGWVITFNPGGLGSLTDANGDYFFSFLPNTYTISEVLKTYWEQTCPTTPGTHTVELGSGQVVTGKDFGNRPIANIQDLSVTVAGGTARPGFQKLYGINYQNKGTTTTSGTVILTLPPEVSHVESSPGGVYDAFTHTVTWDVGSLVLGFIGSLWTKVQIPSNVPLGDTLLASAVINPTAGDANPADNSELETQGVRGSFDPNDKLVIPAGIGAFAAILKTETIRYQIRFQNVGTDTAFNIVVRDTLEPNLDITTVESGASSHPYVFNISGRELSWTFANINLEDSTTNEAGSHGFVTFRVKPKSDIIGCVDVQNYAAVYFDFNEPVITNTVINRVVELFAKAGDANGDNSLNLTDIIFNVNYVFKGGPAPSPICRGNDNADASVNLIDIIYKVNYVFKGGPAPQKIGVCCL